MTEDIPETFYNEANTCGCGCRGLVGGQCWEEEQNKKNETKLIIVQNANGEPVIANVVIPKK